MDGLNHHYDGCVINKENTSETRCKQCSTKICEHSKEIWSCAFCNDSICIHDILTRRCDNTVSASVSGSAGDDTYRSNMLPREQMYQAITREHVRAMAKQRLNRRRTTGPVTKRRVN